ncbi:MAG: hypothetical protein KDK70_39375, partial [Myxococcales bacterium]|nr:hypothetical protein [Myxococcales bacterium]
AEPRLRALMPALLDPRNAADVPEAMAAMVERMSAWTLELLAQGRAVGAVRNDLPDALLVALTLAVGEALDRWVAQQVLAEGLESSVSEPPAESILIVIDLLRRLLAPA